MNFSADITTPYDTSCKCRGYSGNDSNKYDPSQIGTQKRCDSYRARSRRNKGVSHCNTCCQWNPVIEEGFARSPGQIVNQRDKKNQSHFEKNCNRHNKSNQRKSYSSSFFPGTAE